VSNGAPSARHAGERGGLPDPPEGAQESAEGGDALPRLRLVLGYDGSRFSGLAPNRDRRTVGGAVLEAISTVVGPDGEAPGPLRMAGRTDAGVHARAQVVDVGLGARAWERIARRGRGGPWEPALARSLGKLLAPEIAIRSVDVSPPGFDPRRSALGRRYRYAIWQGSPEPLLHGRAWAVGATLERRLVWLAADALLGERDFSALCRRPPGHVGPVVRRLRGIEVAFSGPKLAVVMVEADSFCHQMVRSLVAVLVAAGSLRLPPGEISGLLASGDRSGLPSPAPADGLCFWEVDYPPGQGPDPGPIGPVLPWALAEAVAASG